MKRFFITIAIIISISKLFGQCKQYIATIATDALSPYTSDGNFYAPVVYEGEKIKFTRTFLAGKQYKIAVIGLDFLSKEITVRDADGFVIFANYESRKTKKHLNFTDYQGNVISALGSNYFEFKPEVTGNYTIEVKIEKKAKRKKNRLKGCLGIVIGFMQ